MYLSCEGSVCIIEVSADSSQPNVTTVGEVLCGVHLKHLAHVHHFSLALLTRQVHRGARLHKNQQNMTIATIPGST